MTKQGRQNANQTRAQIEKQDKRNDVELGISALAFIIL